MSPSREVLTGYAVASVTVQVPCGEWGHFNGHRWLSGRLLPVVIELARHNFAAVPTRQHSEDDYVMEILGGLLSRSFAGEQSRLMLSFQRLVQHKSLKIYRRQQQLQREHPARPQSPNQFWPALSPRSFRNGDLPSDILRAIAQEFYHSLITVLGELDNDGLQGGRLIQLLVDGYSVAEIAQIVGRGERSTHRLFQKIERSFIQTGCHGY